MMPSLEHFVWFWITMSQSTDAYVLYSTPKNVIIFGWMKFCEMFWKTEKRANVIWGKWLHHALNTFTNALQTVIYQKIVWHLLNCHAKEQFCKYSYSNALWSFTVPGVLGCYLAVITIKRKYERDSGNRVAFFKLLVANVEIMLPQIFK